MSPRCQARLRIHGRVQGVSFRYYAREQANRLGLVGWVRNARDGTVEALVEGDKDAIERFITWAHVGPTLAIVDRVDVEWDDPTETMTTFRIGGP
jgi:acylphosphatase